MNNEKHRIMRKANYAANVNFNTPGAISVHADNNYLSLHTKPLFLRGYPIGSTTPYILGADQFLVSGGFDLHGLLGESVEELAAGG